jgi:hypothetical protein
LDLMLQTSWSPPKSTPTKSACSFWALLLTHQPGIPMPTARNLFRVRR